MPAAPQSSGIELGAAPKNYRLEQDKLRPPEETVTWVRSRFQELGREVLKKTMRIDTGRLDIPVYISLCGQDATALTGTSKQMGKGASPSQAEASALMELAERFSFFHFVKTTDFPLLTPDQAGEQAMPFEQIMRSLYHPAQDAERARAVYGLLPQRWCWARNLTADREELLPLDWFYTINEYNGPAAGNCLEEAVLQSLCEVVERHVSALVTLEQRRTPAIDPQSIEDPVARDLVDKFQAAGIRVFLKDYTCDLGIPSVAALCYDPESFPHKSEIVYAAGTATTPAKALIRALTEVAQLAGDFMHHTSYLVSALPKFRTLEEAAYVTEPAGSVPLDSLPDVGRDDFRDEVLACVQALEERGFSVYTINVTHPELKVPAVYTIVPGAHFAYRTTGTDVVFHAAKLASQLEDPELSVRVLGEMSRRAGQAYYLHFFHALALLNLGRADRALSELETALSLGPTPEDEASIHTQIGVALKDMGLYGEAKKALQKAASFPEPHHEVFNLLGFCHFKLGEYQQAIEAFGRAIEIEPGVGINYANIGTNLRELGRIDEAIEMYRHALELDPGLDFARDNLNRLLASRSG